MSMRPSDRARRQAFSSSSSPSMSRIAIASAVLAGVSYEIWHLLDEVLGRGLAGQIASLAAGLGLGGLAYVAVCQLLRVPELDQVMAVVRRRSS